MLLHLRQRKLRGMFDPELEARVAAAVSTLLSTPDDDGAATHALCEAANGLLQALLQIADDWPEDSFVDGLMPLSILKDNGAVELAAAAVVEQDERWLLEPLLARFALDGDALSELSLLFAYAEREPPPYDPERQDFTLELPSDANGYRYRLTTEPDDALD